MSGLIIDPWLAVEDMSDKQLMASILLSIAPDKKALEWRLYREVQKRVNFVLLKVTRTLPDPEAAYSETIREMTTDANCRWFADKATVTLATFAATIAKHRTIKDAGLLDATARYLRPDSLDAIAENSPDSIQLADTSAQETWDDLEAGRVANLRQRFNEITANALTEKERRAVEEYANLRDHRIGGMPTRDVVAARMHVSKQRAGFLINEAQRKVSEHDALIGEALRHLIETVERANDAQYAKAVAA